MEIRTTRRDFAGSGTGKIRGRGTITQAGDEALLEETGTLEREEPIEEPDVEPAADSSDDELVTEASELFAESTEAGGDAVMTKSAETGAEPEEEADSEIYDAEESFFGTSVDKFDDGTDRL